ncbi:hypothetical protein D3C84_756430 [compost metagenome]
MKKQALQVEVRFPKKGEEEFDLIVEQLAAAVYEKVKERLEQDAKGARSDISDA